jgi:hypothetical protein
VLSRLKTFEGKTIHIVEVAFLKRFRETAALFVVSGRENFKPNK